MAEDAILSLPGVWEETGFERGQYGPDDTEGLSVTFEGPDATIEVLPVRYRREEGLETVSALDGDWEGGRSDPAVSLPDVGPLTAFATRLCYTPFDVERDSAVCIAADAGDALAVGLWLGTVATDAGELRRHVNNHAGSGAPSGVAVSDDEVLAAVFADEPSRCVFSAKETRSHEIELPYRYAPLLSAARRTNPGVPRFPSTVGRLEGMVSHAAWEEHDLANVAFDAPIERAGPGEYHLPESVAEAVAGTDAESYALRRLGVE